MSIRPLTLAGVFLLLLAGVGSAAADEGAPYLVTPFHDRVYPGGPQKFRAGSSEPTMISGGEGVAYHDSDARNRGRGGTESGGRELPQRISPAGGRRSLARETPRPDRRQPVRGGDPAGGAALCRLDGARGMVSHDRPGREGGPLRGQSPPYLEPPGGRSRSSSTGSRWSPRSGSSRTRTRRRPSRGAHGTTGTLRSRSPRWSCRKAWPS
jgi:hypothetical protein